MRQYATFDENGDILAIITTNVDEPPGENYVDIPPNLVVGTGTHYIDTETHDIKEREKIDLNISHGPLSVTIDGLPEKSKIFACGQKTTVNDGVLTITLDLPELINVTIDAGPQYIKEFMEIQID